MASWHDDFVLGDWHVSPKLNRVRRGDERITVKNKSMAVLVFLVDAAGEVVTRDEIMDAVWPGMEVTDDVLTQSVVELRKALDDDAKHPKIIQTIPRVGFRLVASIDDLQMRRLPARPLQVGIALVAVAVVAWIAIEWAETARDPVITVQDSPSIAVLPFENLSADPANEFVAEGTSEEIRGSLAKIPELTVIGRLSSHAVKNDGDDLKTIGQELGVRSILEGTVRASGDRIRISTQLTDVSSGAVIWSDTHESTISDIFEMQDSVAADVIDALQVRVVSRPVRKVSTDKPEAWKLFVAAQSALYKGQPRRAEDLLFGALRIDPDFAKAYELLAYFYYAHGGVGQDGLTTQRLVHNATGRAIEIDPDLHFADVMYRSSTPGTDYLIALITLTEDALAEDPNNPWLLDTMVWFPQEAGYMEDSLPWAERYLQVEPLSPFADAYYTAALYSVGRVEEALARIDVPGRSDMGVDFFQLTLIGIMLAEGEDEFAINKLASLVGNEDEFGTNWFTDLVEGARDPAFGADFLDDRLTQLISSFDDEVVRYAWQSTVPILYLVFGHLDRYFDLIYDSNPTDETWHHAANFIWLGTVFRHSEFTAHSDYLKVARIMGIDRAWDERGAPDFCQKAGEDWVCE
jgi:TolB-like protein/DNA-binding winged helix-turn-helix (wHTH) protein